MQQRLYMTVDEIAVLLGVTNETVRGYINAKKDKLPAYRLGREWRIERKDFEAWLERRKNTQKES